MSTFLYALALLLFTGACIGLALAILRLWNGDGVR